MHACISIPVSHQFSCITSLLHRFYVTAAYHPATICNLSTMTSQQGEGMERMGMEGEVFVDGVTTTNDQQPLSNQIKTKKRQPIQRERALPCKSASINCHHPLKATPNHQLSIQGIATGHPNSNSPLTLLK